MDVDTIVTCGEFKPARVSSSLVQNLAAIGQVSCAECWRGLDKFTMLRFQSGDYRIDFVHQGRGRVLVFWLQGKGGYFCLKAFIRNFERAVFSQVGCIVAYIRNASLFTLYQRLGYHRLGDSVLKFGGDLNYATQRI